MKELFLFKPNLRNIWIHSATCSCIFELLDYKRFFPQLPFFGGLLMYQRKISEVAMGRRLARNARGLPWPDPTSWN